MAVLSKVYNMCLLAIEDITSMAGSEIKLEDVGKVINSEVTNEEKTNFIIQYILAQREPMLNFLKTIIFAFVVFIIGRKIVKALLGMTSKAMERKEVELSIQKFVMSFAGLAYNTLLVFIIAGILGVGASSIVAMLGSAGLAVGLALQGSLSNLAGGVLILLLKPFKVGDYIITSGEEGTVTSIDIFYTRIHTTDNKVIVIPNGTISSSNVTNTSNQPERMLIVDFMVSYGAKTSEVRSLIMAILRSEESICQDKDMSVVICSLNPLRVKMQAKAWVKNSEYWITKFALLEKIKDTLMENGIDIS
ncbi:MAG: mechanosensitive ion channel [Lachnospiraceae bacterium]|nr:mechanosensitive ion channel [Lachnospiraceae bacterium]